MMNGIEDTIGSPHHSFTLSCTVGRWTTSSLGLCVLEKKDARRYTGHQILHLAVI